MKGFFFLEMNINFVNLVNFLYGLKQAPKQWGERIDSEILSFGFRHNAADKCIYSKFTSDYGVIIVFMKMICSFLVPACLVLIKLKFLTSIFKMKNLN